MPGRRVDHYLLGIIPPLGVLRHVGERNLPSSLFSSPLYEGVLLSANKRINTLQS